MATQDDVRRIVKSLSGAVEGADDFAFSVEVKGKPRGFAWRWMERVHPKKPRVPNPDVLAIVVPDLAAKELFLDDRKFVTDPHYNGYPAILVRLAEVDSDELRDLLTAAYECTLRRQKRPVSPRSARE